VEDGRVVGVQVRQAVEDLTAPVLHRRHAHHPVLLPVPTT
jgi:hypothetical protein